MSIKNKNEIFQNMESKFFNLFKKFDHGNLTVALFEFKTEEEGTNIKQIWGQKDNIVPASITKLFSITYFLNVFNSYNIELNTIITVGNEINKNFLSPTLFKIGLKKNKDLTLKDLIFLSIVPSGGDAVYVLTRVIFNLLNQNNLNNEIVSDQHDFDNMIKFISSEINTYFRSKNILTEISDPTGINRDNLKISELGKLTNFLIKNNHYLLNLINNERSKKISNVRKLEFKTTNYLMRKENIYFNPNIIGLKTGTLRDWHNLYILYKLNTKQYISILVAGCANKNDVKTISNYLIFDLENNIRKLLTQ